MYSGITQGVFSISKLEKQTDLINYSVVLAPELVDQLKIGDSVNVNGVCQSVTHIKNCEVSFTAIAESLRLTTLKTLTLGEKVSIECSLRYHDQIGGHLLAGHVCGTAVVDQVIQGNNQLTLTFRCPLTWMKYIFNKGFIAVDGSSLTISQPIQEQGLFSVHLTPETLARTLFGHKKIGDEVNIELDHQTKIIVDTVTRLFNEELTPGSHSPTSPTARER